MESTNQKTTRKAQVQMGGQRQTGHLPNEGQKLDNLRPGSREMERCRWEGRNFQLLKEVQCLKKTKRRSARCRQSDQPAVNNRHWQDLRTQTIAVTLPTNYLGRLMTRSVLQHCASGQQQTPSPSTAVSGLTARNGGRTVDLVRQLTPINPYPTNVENRVSS